MIDTLCMAGYEIKGTHKERRASHPVSFVGLTNNDHARLSSPCEELPFSSDTFIRVHLLKTS